MTMKPVLGNPLFPPAIVLVPISLENSSPEIGGLQPKVGQCRCPLLVSTFASLHLGMKRRSSLLLMDTGSLESQMQVWNGTLKMRGLAHYVSLGHG